MKAGILVSAMVVVTVSCGSANARVADEYLLCPSGQAVLVVRNNDSDVEIVEARAGSGARAVIAIVGRGSHQVQIRNTGGYYYYARRLDDGRYVSQRGGRRGSVELHRECRH
jgi:hypothetical protein